MSQAPWPAVGRDGLVTVDRDGTVLAVDAVAERVLRRRREDLVGLPVDRLFAGGGPVELRDAVADSPAGQACGAPQSVPMDPAAADVEAVWAVTRQAAILRGDGVQQAVDLTITRLHRRRRPMYLVAVRVVADREAELFRQVETGITTHLGHEFRAALTGIQAFSELIRDTDLSPEETRDFANDINSDARRLTQMIGDLLGAERAGSGPAGAGP